MSIQADGQVKCDKCGVLDGNTVDNKLVSGWIRVTEKVGKPIPMAHNSRDGWVIDRHYCPEHAPFILACSVSNQIKGKGER